MKEVLGIIPARYGSTRFPGKPLVDIGGKPMIERVYDQTKMVFEYCYVATDDERIKEAVLEFGGKVVMTSDKHKSGTDRCLEAYEKITAIEGKEFSCVVNIQGDEPFVHPVQLKTLVNILTDENSEAQIATLVKKITDNADVFDVNLPKVVMGKNKEALYFSRSPIPFVRDTDNEEWSSNHTFYKHIGLYAYKSEVLKEITKLDRSSLEIAESLEQLRWLENGYNITVAETSHESVSIDTPEDLEKVLSNLV